MSPLLCAEVAWYVTGRFYVANDGSIQDVGYFLHLQGVAEDLFAGERGEGTARITFAATARASRLPEPPSGPSARRKVSSLQGRRNVAALLLPAG